MFPQLVDKILITLHGYRSPGHRVIALKTDASTGLPLRAGKGTFRDDNPAGGAPLVKKFPDTPASTDFEDVISGWYDAPGVRPKGAPIAVAEASDGSLWFADDKNHAILRIAADNSGTTPSQPVKRANATQAYSDVIKESPNFRKAYTAVRDTVLKSQQCTGCHDSFTNTGETVKDDYQELRYIVGMGNWLAPGSLNESALYAKLTPVGSAAMPPIDKPWSSTAQGQSAVAAVQNLINVMPKANEIWKVKAGRSPAIVGLTRGQPGNGPCGNIKAETYIQVLTSTPTQLGGKKVHEILVGVPSSIANLTNCKSYNAFYVPLDDIEPFL